MKLYITFHTKLVTLLDLKPEYSGFDYFVYTFASDTLVPYFRSSSNKLTYINLVSVKIICRQGLMLLENVVKAHGTAFEYA